MTTPENKNAPEGFSYRATGHFAHGNKSGGRG